ncbi:MAG: TonB family protein [Proteobacteria bacterium]|nr:TonB family protein [Pseudomonadota bacterium]
MKTLFAALGAAAVLSAATAPLAKDYTPTGEAGRWIAEANQSVRDRLVTAGAPATDAQVSFGLNAEGAPQAVRLDRSSGSEAFDKAAVAAVRKAHFRSPPPTALLASRITVRLSADAAATQAAR